MHHGLVNQVLHVHEHPHIIDVKINLHKAGEHITEGKILYCGRDCQMQALYSIVVFSVDELIYN